MRSCRPNQAPLDVGLVEGEDVPEETVRIGSCDCGEAEYLGHHEHHDEAAVSIDGYVARRLGCVSLRRFDVCTVLELRATGYSIARGKIEVFCIFASYMSTNEMVRRLILLHEQEDRTSSL